MIQLLWATGRLSFVRFLPYHPLPFDEFSFKEINREVNPRFHVIVFVYGVTQEN